MIQGQRPDGVKGKTQSEVTGGTSASVGVKVRRHFARVCRCSCLPPTPHTIVHFRESVLLSLWACVAHLTHAPLLADVKVRQPDGDVLFNLDRPIKDLPSPVTASLITVRK